ncbi:MAG: tetratricopeptide repeat protein [Myxococcota bacterium]|nr:tetratricopeptide repeat protein [Myxococcota bacterium]
MMIRSCTIIFSCLLVSACGGQPNQVQPTESASVNTVAAPPVAAPIVLNAEQADSLMDEAQTLAFNGDLTTAEEKFREVLDGLSGTAGDTAKRRADVQYNLGILAEWQGRYPDARRRYDEAIVSSPEMGRAVIAIGRLMMRSGDQAGAINYARGRLVGRAKSKPLRNALNRLRLAANIDLAEVERDSKRVLREDEKNVDAMINLAVAYHRAGKYELAIAVLENAKALEEAEPEIYWRISQARLALKDKLRARLILEEATRLESGATAEIYNNLGVIYHEAGDFSGAELQFRKALARWPDMIAAQVNLGNALKGQQRFAEALEALKVAESKDPQNAVVAYNIGILLLDGQFADMDSIQRLNDALSYFSAYKQKGRVTSAQDIVNAYIAEAKKRIKVEEKRAEQMRRMKQKQPEQAPEPAVDAPGDEAGDANPAESNVDGSQVPSNVDQTGE